MIVPLSIPARGARPFDFVGLGENSVDLVAVADLRDPLPSKRKLQDFAQLAGGQAATAAAACARLGWKARYLGAFGDDELGRFVREHLMAEGVDVVAARTVPGATSRLAVILVDARTGERHVLWHRDARLQAAWTGRPDDLTELAASGRLLLVDADNVAASALAAAAARRAGIPTLVDVDEVGPGVDELLRDIDVIVVAEPFPGELTGQPDLGRALEALEREYHAALVVVTLGAQGSLARCGGREIRTAAYPVGCVDSTGAGDVFRGALAAAMLRDSTGSVEAALEFANAAAALNCRGLGASGGLPTLPEVDRLVSSRSDQV